jgi:RNA polymerase sigma-32 factor
MSFVEFDSHFAFYKGRVAAGAVLSQSEEATLARNWRAGDDRAGARLIESNLRQVIAIAREYRRWGVPIDDLVQQGSIGLLKAAQRFDPEQGISLRTYAAYWIRAELRDYVVRCYRIVRLGATRTERRALRAFRTSSVADAAELAARSGMPEARCQLLWPLLGQHDRSLDQPMASGAAARESLPASTPDPEALALAREEASSAGERVQRALALLSERERRIIWARLAEEEPETLEALGRRLGVSRERVRQLESRARNKLREALAVTA